jgi:hypothetical protein
MSDEPKWTPELEKTFVKTMGKGMTVEEYENQEGAEGWRSSEGAMEWLKQNYKKTAGKRKKTRKTKKKKTRRSRK